MVTLVPPATGPYRGLTDGPGVAVVAPGAVVVVLATTAPVFGVGDTYCLPVVDDIVDAVVLSSATVVMAALVISGPGGIVNPGVVLDLGCPVQHTNEHQ